MTKRFLQAFLQRAAMALALLAAAGTAVAQASSDVIPGVGVWASVTEVASSANPVVYGTAPTLTATVTGRRALFPGTVTFYDGPTAIGTVNVSARGRVGTATLVAPVLAAGTRAITAAYSGDRLNPGSTSTVLPLVVNRAPSTIAISASPNPATFGQDVILSATVSGPGAVRTGSVTFQDGGTALGSASIDSAGAATLTASLLTAGSHILTASYAGDGNNQASLSAATTQTVNKAGTSITFTSSRNPSTVGEPVTFAATVTGPAPTGAVTFADGGTPIGSAPLNNGVATLTVTTLGSGNRSIVASYGGDANQEPSSSAPVTQVVNRASTTTVATANPASAHVGANVTLAATVTGVGAEPPSGFVIFSEGGTVLGQATLSGGTGSIAVSSLAAGSHSITANYGGDAGNAPSSGSTTVTITKERGPYVWQYGYDAMGRITTVLDPNTLASFIYYDELGRPIQTQQPANVGASTPTATDFAYNLRGDLTQVTDPRSLTTTYSPNAVGDVTAQTSPDTGVSQYTHDANGNVLTKTDARGKLTQYTYDGLNRVTRIDYPTGAPTTFEYDGGATPVPAAIGKVTKMTDESGQTTYGYDSMGRLTTKTVVIAGKTFTVRYAWGDGGGALDKLTAITYPSGSRVNYSYDQYGNVSGITVNPVNANGQGVSATTTTLLSGITYNADKRVTGWLWSDGKQRTIGYDAIGMISSYTLGDPNGSGTAAGLLRSIERDSAGRITGYKHTNNGTVVAGFDQSFGYDDLGRLTSATQSSITTLYAYDANGNRTAKTIGGTTYANTVSPTSNRLSQVQGPAGTAPINHDAAGNVVRDGSFAYAYSDRGRMSGATAELGSVSYLYNGSEQRVKKSGPTNLVATGGSHYVYDEAGKLLGEYDGNGIPLYETIYLGSAPVGALKQTGTAATGDIAVSVYNVHADQIDTPRVITRQDETIVWRWDAAESFGATAPDQNPSALGIFTYSQRFPGQVFDAETGLFQNWNRDYRAGLGRYIQSDPIGLAGGTNTFAYAANTPVMASDPSGLAVEWSGSIATAGATTGLGGQLAFFSLTSECKCGKKITIRGFASIVTIGAGVSLRGVGDFLKEASGTSSSTRLTDQWADCPDAASATGSAWQSGVNVVVGAGGTLFPAVKLGRLRMSGLVDGPAFGFDLSLTSTVWGQSVVTSSEVEVCCEKK